MSFRILLAVGLLVGFVTSAAAQAPLRLQISDGRVTLHAENVPIRTILAEWARVGGTTILNGDRVAGTPLTLELEGVPERRALDIVLRSVSGYVVAARQAGKPGASIYDRIMGAAALLTERLLSQWIGGDAFLRQVLRLSFTIVFALLVLAGAAHLLRIREFREAIAFVLKRGGSEA